MRDCFLSRLLLKHFDIGINCGRRFSVSLVRFADFNDYVKHSRFAKKYGFDNDRGFNIMIDDVKTAR